MIAAYLDRDSCLWQFPRPAAQTPATSSKQGAPFGLHTHQALVFDWKDAWTCSISPKSGFAFSEFPKAC